MRNTELISHHQPEEIGKEWKEMPHVLPPPGVLLAEIHLGWAMRVAQEGPWVRIIGQRQPETRPITHCKTRDWEPCGREFLRVPLPCHSPPWHPFPIKSVALSAQVSPQTIHFWVLDKNPLSGPGRGPPPTTYSHCCWSIYYIVF